MPDWTKFLTQHGIEFSYSSKSNVVIHCPFCGAADPSQHLGISLLGRGWRCLRNPQHHRGRSAVRLVAALLQCTDERARDLLGEDAPPLPSEDTFSKQWRAQLGLASDKPERPVHLELPREFKSLMKWSRYVDAFWDYLQQRGYSFEQSRWLVQTYKLHYAVRGDFAYRVIIPIFAANGVLMTWTGRTIRPAENIRYKTLATELSCTPATNLLLGLPLLWEAKVSKCLVICEGPFDALTVSILGHKSGVWGTCLFGKNISEAQADLLADLTRRFSRMRLLVDADARLDMLRLRERLPRICQGAVLPPDVKDPGELRGDAGTSFVRAL